MLIGEHGGGESKGFDVKQTNRHFSNPDYPKCFACNSALLKVQPRQVTRNYLLLPATQQVDGTFVVMEGCWLVFPREHVTSYMEMPYDWTESVRIAVYSLGLQEPFCISENWGKAAGQTAEHGHTWIIQRGGDEGLLSHERGLATLVWEIQQQFIPYD